jgi:hypothetical protein
MNKFRDITMDNQQVSLIAEQGMFPIPGQSGYWTDGLGDIWSTKQTKPKKLKKRIHFGKSKSPYMRVKVGEVNALLHRVVASVHMGRPLTNKEVVNHINGDTTDNSLMNLEVTTHRENVLHAVANSLYCSGEAWHKAREITKL